MLGQADPVGTAANPTPLIVAAAIYLIILLPLVRLVGMLEKRLAKSER